MSDPANMLQLLTHRVQGALTSPEVVQYGYQAYGLLERGYGVVHSVVRSASTFFVEHKPNTGLDGDMGGRTDMTSILITLVSLLVLVKLLDIGGRMVFSWIRFVIQLVFFLGLIVVGLYIWINGPENSLNKIQSVYASELDRWESDVRQTFVERQRM